MLYTVAGPMPFLLSSLALIGLCGLSIICFGPISVQTFTFMSVYTPALAFFWAYIRGSDYINWHSHWLQDIPFYVDLSVHLSLVAAFFSFAIMVASNKGAPEKTSIRYVKNGVSPPIYLTLIVGAGFFFWLTDPVFATIITHSYEYILANRFSNTQYAGSVAIIIWLIALSNYLRLTHVRLKRKTEIFAQRFFILLTVAAFAWLALHARRSELIGMGLVGLLILRDQIGITRSTVLGATLLAILIFVQEIRAASLSGMLSSTNQIASDGYKPEVASLPGGASNIFMTFVNTLHYFNNNALLAGSTFTDYLLNILPTPIYQALGVATPDYFYEKVFTDYSYNGGTYVGAVFYGNFGILGMIIFGAFVGAYASLAKTLTYSTDFMQKATGFFLVALTFRGFWYELIIILKPLIIVLLPGYFITTLLFRTSRNKETKTISS